MTPKTPKFPSIPSLEKLCLSIKADLKNSEEMDVTIGADGVDWAFQTGDNTYTGPAYHYPHWGVSKVTVDSNCREMARCLQRQVMESYFETKRGEANFLNKVRNGE
jgi:hypothetical protein